MMHIDELVIKREFDQLRLDILDGNIDPKSEFGFVGALDELAYKGWTKVTGRASKKRDYFQDQIEWVNHELERRLERGERPSEEVSQIVAQPYNEATFYVLSNFRENFRKNRIKDMNQDGEKLFASEAVRLGQKKVSDFNNAVHQTISNINYELGEFADNVRNNSLYVVALGLTVAGLWFGSKWMQAEKVYAQTAQKYVNSIVYGRDTLAVKRDIPELLTVAGLKLVYIPPNECDSGDDDCIATPEIRADPEGAAIYVLQANQKLGSHLSSANVESWNEILSQAERERIYGARDRSSGTMTRVYIQLASRTSEEDEEYTHTGAQGDLIYAAQSLQDAVGILESHMDKGIVDQENKDYEDKTMKMLLTLGSFGGAGLAAYNAKRRAKQDWRAGRNYGINMRHKRRQGFNFN